MRYDFFNRTAGGGIWSKEYAKLALESFKRTEIYRLEEGFFFFFFIEKSVETN